jgi:GNAT superfamily N-acetyltransferase
MFLTKVAAKYEIISAAIPAEIFGRRKDKGWFSLISKPFPGLLKNFLIEAVEKKTGVTIGTAEILYITHWKDRMVAANVYVKDEYQRRGVATAMYDFAEEITGKEMLPYSHQISDEPMSEDAKKFWKKRKPSLEWD